MQHCGISERKMAVLTGFSRPYISMMREGKRCSPNYEQIKCLIYNLNLTPKEEREIIDAYWQERLGKEDIVVYEEIRKMVEAVNHEEAILGKTHLQYELNMQQQIVGEMNITEYAQMLLQKQTDSVAKIVVPAKIEEFCHMLNQMLHRNPALVIEHLFSMDNEVTTRELHNIRILKNIFLNMLHGARYYPMYYYIKQVYSDPNGVFPYFILVDDRLMIISETWKHACIISEPYLIDGYQRQYEIKRRQCQPLFQYMSGIDCIMKGLCGFYSETDVETQEPFYSLEYEPCLLPYLTEDILEHIQQDVDISIRQKTLQYLQPMLPQCQKKGVLNYFSAEGLNEFVVNGRMSILPTEFYRPFTPKERLQLLECFLEQIKAKKVIVHMIDDRQFHFPKHLGIYANTEGSIAILYMKDEKRDMFRINDMFSRACLYRYLRHLDKSKYVLDGEVSVRMLESLVVELRNKIEND